MNTPQKRNKATGVSVGAGQIDGEEVVLLHIHDPAGNVGLSAGCARFLAQQLIQWADYLTPAKGDEVKP